MSDFNKMDTMWRAPKGRRELLAAVQLLLNGDELFEGWMLHSVDTQALSLTVMREVVEHPDSAGYCVGRGPNKGAMRTHLVNKTECLSSVGGDGGRCNATGAAGLGGLATPGGSLFGVTSPLCSSDLDSKQSVFRRYSGWWERRFKHILALFNRPEPDLYFGPVEYDEGEVGVGEMAMYGFMHPSDRGGYVRWLTARRVDAYGFIHTPSRNSNTVSLHPTGMLRLPAIDSKHGVPLLQALRALVPRMLPNHEDDHHNVSSLLIQAHDLRAGDLFWATDPADQSRNEGRSEGDAGQDARCCWMRVEKIEWREHIQYTHPLPDKPEDAQLARHAQVQAPVPVAYVAARPVNLLFEGCGCVDRAVPAEVVSKKSAVERERLSLVAALDGLEGLPLDQQGMGLIVSACADQLARDTDAKVDKLLGRAHREIRGDGWSFANDASDAPDLTPVRRFTFYERSVVLCKAGFEPLVGRSQGRDARGVASGEALHGASPDSGGPRIASQGVRAPHPSEVPSTLGGPCGLGEHMPYTPQQAFNTPLPSRCALNGLALNKEMRRHNMRTFLRQQDRLAKLISTVQQSIEAGGDKA